MNGKPLQRSLIESFQYNDESKLCSTQLLSIIHMYVRSLQYLHFRLYAVLGETFVNRTSRERCIYEYSSKEFSMLYFDRVRGFIWFFCKVWWRFWDVLKFMLHCRNSRRCGNDELQALFITFLCQIGVYFCWKKREFSPTMIICLFTKRNDFTRNFIFSQYSIWHSNGVSSFSVSSFYTSLLSGNSYLSQSNVSRLTYLMQTIIHKILLFN